MKPVLGHYPDIFNWIEVWGIEWPVLHLDVVILKKIHNHSCFVYWSIDLLEDGIPKRVMDTFKDWKKNELKKLDIDTLVDRFDNKRAVGSTVPAPKTTPHHQENPSTL